MEAAHVLNCPACGQANRVPSLGDGKRAVCGRCRADLDRTGKPIALQDSDFHEVIGSGEWVVDFWAAWCGPCRMIAPVIDELAHEQTDVRFGKLNVDQNPRTAAEFRVQGIPLLIFFRDGVEAGRVTGAVPKGQIEAGIRRFLGK